MHILYTKTKKMFRVLDDVLRHHSTLVSTDIFLVGRGWLIVLGLRPPFGGGNWKQKKIKKIQLLKHSLVSPFCKLSSEKNSIKFTNRRG